MDKYIIERRTRIRLAWFKRHEVISNINQVCRESGISRKAFYNMNQYKSYLFATCFVILYVQGMR